MKVTCELCGKEQQDEGKRSTCEKCGMSPLPSYSYPVGHVFHPNTGRKPKPAQHLQPQPRNRRSVNS